MTHEEISLLTPEQSGIEGSAGIAREYPHGMDTRAVGMRTRRHGPPLGDPAAENRVALLGHRPLSSAR